MRGPMLFVSVLSSPDGNTPVKTPEPPASTGATALKLGAASRLTRGPPASVYGSTSSYRRPRLNVSFELLCQLSSIYASKDFPRSCVVPPTCSAACCGNPSRKSANAALLAAFAPLAIEIGRPLVEYRPVNV